MGRALDLAQQIDQSGDKPSNDILIEYFTELKKAKVN